MQQDKAKAGQKQDFPQGIPECGADALRFGLLAYTVQGRDVNLDIQRVVGYRQFCNKIWNAVKFALTYVSDFSPSPETAASITSMPGVSTRDLYVLHHFNATITSTEANMKAYVFGNVTMSLHAFFVYELCDVYLELSKPVFNDASAENAATRRAAQATLYTVLEQYLRLAHPLMPFVTEELWQRLPNRMGLTDVPSIMIAKYPAPEDSWHSPESAKAMDILKEAIGAGRSLRASYNVGNHVKTKFYYRTKDAALASLLKNQSSDFCTLARAELFEAEPASGAPKGSCVKVINDQLSILMDLTGAIDLDKEIERLTKDLARLNPTVESLERKMSDASYAMKVPPAVQEANTAKLQATKTEIATVTKAIDDFKSMK